MFTGKNRHFRKFKHSLLSLVLAYLLDHFLSKVHFQVLHDETLCRDLAQEVIEVTYSLLIKAKK